MTEHTATTGGVFPADFIEHLTRMSESAEGRVRAQLLRRPRNPEAWGHAEGRAAAIADVLSVVTGEPPVVIRVRAFEAVEREAAAGFRGVAMVRRILRRD